MPSGSAAALYRYDTLGNLISVTNPLGHQVTFSNYDAMGRPGRTTGANGVSMDYAYDAKGNLLTATKRLPTGDRTTTFVYNNNRQVTDVLLPDGSAVRYRYSAGARLEKIGNVLGQYLSLPINVGANSVAVRSDRQVPVMSGSTPAAQPAAEFVKTTELDSLGRVRREVGNNSQVVTYTYDKNSNVKTRTDAVGHTTVYEYDAQDRVTRLTAPDGGITSYGYDTEGNLAAVTDPRGLLTTYSYNGLGQVSQQVSPDTGVTTYTYDSAGRLQTETRASGQAITYAWDALDRLTGRTAGGVSETFAFDEGPYGKGKLTRINDSTGQTDYQYAADGQLTRQVNSIFGNKTSSLPATIAE